MHKRFLYFLFVPALFWWSCHKTDGAGPSISTISPSSGLGGNLVTITGKGFSPDGTQDLVTFNGIAARVVEASATRLVVEVPNSATSGPVAVAIGNLKTTGPVYTISSVVIASVSPNQGSAGDTVIIKGSGFFNTGSLGSRADVPKVYFNGRRATVYSSSDTVLAVLVPDSASFGPVTIKLDSVQATGPDFYFIGLSAVHPLTGNVGTAVTLLGGFGTDPSKCIVTIGGQPATIDSATTQKLVVTVARGDTTGPVVVTLAGRNVKGSRFIFSFVPAPVISQVLPSSGPVGTKVTLTGTYFSPVATEDTVFIGGAAATVVSASSTQLVVLSPVAAINGPVSVHVNGQASAAGPVYTYQNLGITAINPANAAPPCTLTISGFGFGTVAANDIVQINGVACPITNIVDTQLVVNVPSGVTSGAVIVRQGSLTANGPVFSTAGVITFAGGTSGLQNGVGTQAQFEAPRGLVVDAAGNVYVDDISGNNIRKIAPDGTVTNFAGDPGGSSGYQDGVGSGALFSTPYNIAIDHLGNLYVSDHGNNVVRKITANGTVSTFASMPDGGQPVALTCDKNNNLYVTEFSNVVYEFSSAGLLLNTINISQGNVLDAIVVDDQGNIYTKDYTNGNIFKGMSVVASFGYSFYGSMKLAADGSGNIFIANGIQSNTNAIYTFNPATQTITIVAGNAGGASGFQDGTLLSALFNWPDDVAEDAQGNLYVAEQGNSAVRKITLH